jgi:hypothetical protein
MCQTDRRVLGNQEERYGEQRAANNAGHRSPFVWRPPLAREEELARNGGYTARILLSTAKQEAA